MNKRARTQSSTRDAVETAIDLSKGDKNASWDSLVERESRRSHRNPEAESESVAGVQREEQRVRAARSA